MGLVMAGTILDGPFRYEEALSRLRGKDNDNIVYLITSADGVWSYAGSTSLSSSRFVQHMYELNHGVHTKPELQQAYNNDGYVLFYFSVCATPQVAIDNENAMLKEIHGSPGCLNAAIDAERPWLRGENYVHPLIGKAKSEETKQRISSTRQDKLASGEIVPSMLGKKHSEEAKGNMRIARQELFENGYAISEDTRSKLSAVNTTDNHAMAKPCMVKGTRYGCVSSAAAATGIKYSTLYYWVTKGKND